MSAFKVSGGTLDEAAAKQAVWAIRGTAKECFKRTRTGDAASEPITVYLQVSRTGKVMTVSSRPKVGPFLSCIKGSATSIRLPALTEGSFATIRFKVGP